MTEATLLEENRQLRRQGDMLRQLLGHQATQLKEVEKERDAAIAALELEKAKPRVAQLRRMAYQDYLATPEWQETRKLALATAEHHCQLCNAGGELNVHHRTYERIGEERPADLIVLCKDCHATFHDKLPKAVF